ncbi:hypothetical protein GCK32_002316 [Trichostrongylus colubriformis]|uniref:Uncharacterized protein n=1 Tax=Trichostrongylus colubriformis TaxID=6319 RepID=A0AAN8FBH1_TRICO
MLTQVLCSIVLVSIFHLLHYVRCEDGQCSRLDVKINPESLVNGICIHFNVSAWGNEPCNVNVSHQDGKIFIGEVCHYTDLKFSRAGRSYQVDCYYEIRDEVSKLHERYRCIADGLDFMMRNTGSESEYNCLKGYQDYFFHLWTGSISSSTTTSPATTISTTTTPTPTTTTTTATTTPTTTSSTTSTTTTMTTTTTSTTTIMTTTTTSTTTTASTTEFVDTTTASPTTTTALSTLTSTLPYVTKTTTPSIEPLITTTASSTSTEVSELSSIDQGGINETVVISPEREKEYIRIERKRVLDSAKLKLLVISTLMTTGLSIQLLLIRQLRKLLREWYENGLLVEDGVANAVISMAAKKMKSTGRKKMKAKRKGRAKKFGKKPKTHRDSNRPPKEGSANVARSKDVSSDDNTTDLYNFYEGKQKRSRHSFSKESNKSRDASLEGKSKDSKEAHGKKGA